MVVHSTKTDAFFLRHTSTPNKLLLQTGFVRLIRPFGGAATRQDLEPSPSLPFELPEKLARSRWFAGVCRTASHSA